MSTATITDIGSVVVHRGEPPCGCEPGMVSTYEHPAEHRATCHGPNPLATPSLLGDDRTEALSALKHGYVGGRFTYWHVPATGGARRITAGDVDWSATGVE